MLPRARDLKFGGVRVIMPGQVLRFLNQVDWTTFRDLYALEDSAWEYIIHTDPIGLSGGRLEYTEGSSNPLNYLRRAQLPNKKIDMTNKYHPTVWGEVTGVTHTNSFVPYWVSGYDAGDNLEVIYPDTKGTINEIDKPGTNMTMEHMPTMVNLEMLTELLNNAWNVSLLVSANIQTFDIPVSLVAKEVEDYTIPQSKDCSSPTVGCFWFNDGIEPQIELPKSAECRAGILVRFKKLVFL